MCGGWVNSSASVFILKLTNWGKSWMFEWFMHSIQLFLFSQYFSMDFFPRALFEVRPFHQRYLEVHILAFDRRLSYSIREDGCGYCQLSVGNAHSTSLHINDRYMLIVCKPTWIRNCIFLTYDSGSCYTHVSWFSIHFCFYFVFLGSIWINAYINRRDIYRKK